MSQHTGRGETLSNFSPFGYHHDKDPRKVGIFYGYLFWLTYLYRSG